MKKELICLTLDGVGRPAVAMLVHKPCDPCGEFEFIRQRVVVSITGPDDPQLDGLSDEERKAIALGWVDLVRGTAA